MKFKPIQKLDFSEETIKCPDSTIFRLPKLNLNLELLNLKWHFTMVSGGKIQKLKPRALKKKSTSRFRFLALSANCLSLKVWVFRDVCFMTERSIIWSWVKPIYGKILARLSLEKGLLTLRKERKKITTTHDIFLSSKTMSVLSKTLVQLSIANQ